MYWLLALMTLSLFGIIAMGIYFEMRPLSKQAPRWLKSTIAVNLLTFVGAQNWFIIVGHSRCHGRACDD
jgi:V/A-type H+-transporting ATPase subunit K